MEGLSPGLAGKRGLISELSRCAVEAPNLFLQEAVPGRNPIPGAGIAILTSGHFPGLKTSFSIDKEIPAY